jgi:hypothetical protein
MDIKYRIYYAQTSSGPWFLANEGSEVDHVSDDTMSYTITGLGSNVVYWVAIIGGYLQDGEFLPLLSQSIGPKRVGTQGAGEIISAQFKARTFAPHVRQEETLSHTFEVV